MQYNYKAIDSAGNTVSGAIEAGTPEEAQEKLASQGLIPQNVKAGSVLGEDWTKSITQFLTRVKLPELLIFSKQMKTLLKAGLPITSILEILQDQTENPRLKKAAARMREDVQAGKSLAEAFENNPRIFPSLFCSMIRAGEDSGRMVDVMDRLIYLMQHEHKVKSDIKSALTYPIIVLVVLAGAFLFLLTFVIPQFINIFEGAGLDLPLPTRISIVLYEWIVIYWPVTLSLLAAVIAGIYFYTKTEVGQYNKDYFLLKLPLLGVVLQKAAMSRFASIFAILHASGVSVLQSLNVLSGTIGNKVISREFERVQEELRQGRGISGPLGQSKLFPPLVVNMVAIGEESGNLDEMLRDVSNHFDDEVEFAVSRMSELIGPVLVLCLAGMVGFFAMAIFLPMWDMVGMV